MTLLQRVLTLTLLLVLYKLHIQAVEIERTTGDEVKILFSFQNQSFPYVQNKQHSINVNNIVNLYKNDKKIVECSLHCTDSRFMLFHSREVSLSITNLTSSDSGEYYIALMLKNEAPVESEKISLLIHSRETITGTPSTSSASTRHSFHEPSISASSARLYIITALVVIAMVMPIVLINWFCLNQGNKSDTQQPQISGPKCAVTSEASSSKPVCSIEYVMLDFRNRPGGKEGNRWSEASLKPQDSVEYATITFHPTQPGPRVAQEELNTPTESISRMSADTSVIRHNVRRL